MPRSPRNSGPPRAGSAADRATRRLSREIIADSIEAVAGAAGFDGFVAVGGCDKNMPGAMMAMAMTRTTARLASTAVVLAGTGGSG